MIAIIYILGTILGGVSGMLLLGFLYYRNKYNSLNIKYKELDGDDFTLTKSQLKLLQIENNKLKELNESL